MTQNTTQNTDLILQYALLVAGEKDDYFDQQLGPIHLIKYVYLADLLHAKRNKGGTFTGIKWQFYKFGPWSQNVNERIDPALNLISAERKNIPSNYDGDFIRWRIRDPELLKRKEENIPPCIKLHLRQWVLKYGSDTPSLLDFTYKTKPMIMAAPMEFLDFSTVLDDDNSVQEPEPMRMEALSIKKHKKFRESMENIRAQNKNNKRDKSEFVDFIKDSRNDEVYFSGLEWLNSLAGDEFSKDELLAEFDDSVWKSTARTGVDVS